MRSKSLLGGAWRKVSALKFFSWYVENEAGAQVIENVSSGRALAHNCSAVGLLAPEV